MTTTIRFPAEKCRFAESDVNCENEIWEPCLVEMSVDPTGHRDPVYDLEVKEVQPPGEDLSTIRDRVGRIARRLEDVAAELRLVAEGISTEESERMLKKIETSLGIK